MPNSWDDRPAIPCNPSFRPASQRKRIRVRNQGGGETVSPRQSPKKRNDFTYIWEIVCATFRNFSFRVVGVCDKFLGVDFQFSYRNSRLSRPSPFWKIDRLRRMFRDNVKIISCFSFSLSRNGRRDYLVDFRWLSAKGNLRIWSFDDEKRV